MKKVEDQPREESVEDLLEKPFKLVLKADENETSILMEGDGVNLINAFCKMFFKEKAIKNVVVCALDVLDKVEAEKQD